MIYVFVSLKYLIVHLYSLLSFQDAKLKQKTHEIRKYTGKKYFSVDFI